MECIVGDATQTPWTPREYYVKGIKCRGLTKLTDGTREVECQQMPGLDPDDQREGLIRGILSVTESRALAG